MRPVRIGMALEDGGGASSSVAQEQPPAFVGYARVQPPPFWSTPTPYLFIGFAIVMALIAVALAVLLCSRRKEEDEEARRRDPSSAPEVMVLAPLDREDAAMPKVLVVMAGHSAPSFLASAAPLASFVANAKPHLVGGGGDKDGAAA